MAPKRFGITKDLKFGGLSCAAITEPCCPKPILGQNRKGSRSLFVWAGWHRPLQLYLLKVRSLISSTITITMADLLAVVGDMQATPPPSPTPCRKSPRSNHKRARLHGPELPPSLNSPSATCSQHFCGSEAVGPDSALTANSSINADPDITPSNLLDSLSHLKDEAHWHRLSLQQQMIQGKGTETAYPRHVKAYMSFWLDYQDSKAKEIPGLVRIPAHPIIGDKVAVFLQHESTRNKV